MLKSFGGLTEQLFEKSYRDMLYTLYNIADEERYIAKYNGYGYDTDIDSLEFVALDSEYDDEKYLNAFKHYIEDEIQYGKTVIAILIVKKHLFAIKPKNVKVENFIREEKN